MINRLILQIIAGILGIFLSVQFVSGTNLIFTPGQSEIFGIELTERWQIFCLIGMVFGLVNFFIKPILKVITLPLRILTLGLFGLVINMVLLWFVDIIFSELTIDGITSLFWSTIVIWGISFFLGIYRHKHF